MKQNSPLFLLLLTLAILLAACGSPEQNEEPNPNTNGEAKPTDSPSPITIANFTNYSDPLSGLSFAYPDDWFLDNSGEQPSISSHAILIEQGTPPDDPFGFVTMNILGRGMAGVPENPSNDDMVDFLNNQLSTLGITSADLVQEPTPMTINGKSGAVAFIEQLQGDLALSTYLVTFFESDRILLGFNFSNDLEQFQATFDEINESITLSEPNLTLVEGVDQFPDQARTHDETITYPDADQLPPVGGTHDPTWQNCGYYAEPIEAKNAVHSMEHGAVWITYQENLPAGDIEQIAQLASGNTHILISPYPGLQSPIVLTAWSVQLELDSLDDERLTAFITAYQQGPQTPEPGALCLGGIGNPS